MNKEFKKRNAVEIMLSGSLEDYILYLKNLAIAGK